MRTGIHAAWLFLLATTAASAQSVTVVVIDYSGFTAEQMERIIQVAGVPFEHGGIGVSGVRCRAARTPEEPGACSGEWKAGAIVVRLQPQHPRASKFGGEKLGSAFVSPQGGGYATVYVPAVQTFAARRGIAWDIGLGYAIAHEVGHCLLGLEHSVAGLMSATWTREDARSMARLSFGMSRPEARKLAERIGSRK